jgi:hypothetical protein
MPISYFQRVIPNQMAIPVWTVNCNSVGNLHYTEQNVFITEEHAFLETNPQYIFVL